jgi:hypothetical protein
MNHVIKALNDASVLNKRTLDLLRVTLPSRMYAPAVELQRKLSLQCTALCSDAVEESDICVLFGVDQHINLTEGAVHVSVPVLCSVSEVMAFFDKTGDDEMETIPLLYDRVMKHAPRTVDITLSYNVIPAFLYEHDIDHVYASSSVASVTGNSLPLSVLVHSATGGSSFRSTHSILHQLASRGKFRYVHRHLIPSTTISTVTMLQGYGISLDIKNMEYKAIDDTKHASESDSGANDNDAVNAKNADEDLSIPVEGFIFSILLQRKLTLETELSQFRESLLELAASKTDNIKLWDMANMGIAAVQRIVGETEFSSLDDKE